MSDPIDKFDVIHESIAVINESLAELLQAQFGTGNRQRQALFDAMLQLKEFQAGPIHLAEKVFELVL